MNVTVQFSDRWNELQAVIDQPEMRERVCGDGIHPHINPTPTDRLLSVVCNGQPAGFFYLKARGGGLYEVHTLLAVKGAAAIEAGIAGIDLMFLETDCTGLYSWCPQSIPESLLFSLKCGFRKAGRRENFWMKHGQMEFAEVVRLSAIDWLERRRTNWLHVGQTFHAILFTDHSQHHADDPVHDATVGTCLQMARKQPDKALGLYNLWATMFGYQPVSLLTVTRGSVVWDNHDAVLALDRRTGGITILERSTPCQ
jgi:hypothetical protein